MKVLLIDDDHTIRYTLKKVIGKYLRDVQIYTSEDGVEGLGYAYIINPDLIVIDTTLPRYSGRELMEYLVTNDRFRETTIILLHEDGADFGELPINYRQISKKDKNFTEKLLGYITKEEQKRNKVELKIVEKIIKYSNKSNIKTSEIEKSNFFVRIFKYLGYMFDQVLVSFYLTIFFITSGRKEYDENIEQRNKDSERYRRRVYPSIAIFLATIIAILVQIGVLLGAVIGPILVSNRVVNAASYTWDGGGATNNWSDCANWSTNICPTSVDSVTFNNTSTKDSVIDPAWGGTIAGITISSTYSGTITLQRDVTMTAGAQFNQAGGTFDVSDRSIYIGAFVTISGGNFIASSNVTTFRANLTITGGTFDANGGIVNFSADSSGTLSCNGVSFNLVQINNSKTIESNCTLPLGNNPTFAGTQTLRGTLSGSGLLGGQSNGAIIFESGSSLQGFSSISLPGSITINGASVDLSSYTSASFLIFIMNSGSYTAPPQTTILGSFTINGGSFIHNGGIVNFHAVAPSSVYSCNNAVFNLVSISFSGPKTIGSNCQFPLGDNPTLGTSLTILNGTLSGTGILNISGNSLTVNNGASLTGFTGFSATSNASVVLNGGTFPSFQTVSINTGNFTVSGANLDLSGGTSFTTNASLIISSGSINLPPSTDINGSLTISGGTFTAPSGTMTIAGNLTISGAPTFNANGGTITFDGTGGGTLSCNSVTFNLVSFNNSAGKIVESNCSLPLGNNPNKSGAGNINLRGTLSGTGTLNFGGFLIIETTAQLIGFTGLTNISGASLSIQGGVVDFSTYNTFALTGSLLLGSGSITLPNNSDINGSLIISGGTFTAPSGNITLAGALTISGTPTFNHNNGTIIFDGTTTATLSCNNVTFQRVDFNHTSGTKTVNSNCSFPLGNNETIGASTGTGAITLNGGTFSGTGTLTTPLGTLTIQNGGVLSGFTGIVGRGAFTTLATTASTVLDLSSYTTADFNGAFTITAPTAPHTNTFIAPSGNINFGSNFTLGTGVTFNHNNGTIIFDGGGSVIICNNAPFNMVSFTGQTSGYTVHTSCNLPLGNNPTIPNTINLQGTLSGTGTLTLTTGIFTLPSTANLSGFTGLYANQISYQANLDFSNYSPFNVFSFIQTAGTFTAPTGTMVIRSHLQKQSGGTFNHNSGTVEFISAWGQIWSGANTYYNLKVDLSTNGLLSAMFSTTTSGVQTIEGTLELKGTQTSNLVVNSLGGEGNIWNLNLQGTSDVEYVDVQDSNNIGNIIQAGGRNVINSGNNVGWNFDNPTVSNITIENQTNGYVKTQTPTIKFNLTDPEPSEQVRYQIQIDNNQDFSSPEIDFTSELGAQGEKTHTTTNLTDGIYKMRIKGMDGSGGDGGYVNYQNDLKIDTTSPQGSMFVGYTQDSTNRDIFVINKIRDNLSGVSEMIISENPNFTNAVWETYKESKIVRVSEGIGIKQINVKYKDQAGNESITYKAGIEITQTPEENPTIENPNNPTEENEEEQIVLKLFAIKIRDRNNNPLINTIVKIEELGIEVRTDENGIAIFENIPLGSYNILGVTEEGEEFRYPIDITQETELITIEIEERSGTTTIIAVILGLILISLLIVLSTIYFRKSTRGGINN